MYSLGDRSEAEWNADREDSHAVRGESLLARAESYICITRAARFHRASPDGQTTAVIGLVLEVP
jgi:hypothetical protein